MERLKYVCLEVLLRLSVKFEHLRSGVNVLWESQDSLAWCGENSDETGFASSQVVCLYGHFAALREYIIAI
jgi:hypothetical protein